MFNWFKKKDISEADIETLFDDLEATSLNKSELAEQCEELEKEIAMLEKYTKLPSNKVKELEMLVDDYGKIKRTMRSLKARIVKNNGGYRLNKLEDIDKDKMEELKDIEKESKKLETDLFSLSEEKLTLTKRRGLILRAYNLLRALAIITTTIPFAYGFIEYSSENDDLQRVTNILMICTAVCMVVMAVLLIIKQKFDNYMTNNEALQHRVAKLTNKTKIQYYHKHRYLEQILNIYGVKSISELEMETAMQAKKKSSENTYVMLNRQIMDIETSVNRIFNDADISIDAMESLEELLNKCKMASESSTLTKKLKDLKEQIKALKAYEGQIMKQIQAIRSSKQYTDIVDTKLSEYDSKLRSYRALKNLESIKDKA